MDYKLRDNTSIQTIDLPLELREKTIEGIKFMTTFNKRRVVNKIFGSACARCGEIPDLTVFYQLQDAKRVERYCKSCLEKVYERDHII